MAGIYIHVPFCTQRCYYCDFYTSVNTGLTGAFTLSLLSEIELKKDFFANNPTIDTVYFGGGTPSLLSIAQFEAILEKIETTFHISENAEITCEVNPDDLNPKFLADLKKTRVNRLSMGIQSFDDELLKLMHRRHNGLEAEKAIELALKAGFENLSIDFIYGLPGLTHTLWQQTLEKAFSFPVQHISAYHLGIEEGTVFDNWLKKGKITEANENDSWWQFQLLHDIADLKGFEHYEISNLSLPGKRSRHNTSYWNNIPYLGLGPSAHGFDGTNRFWNAPDVNAYISAIKMGRKYQNFETLTLENRLHETIMVRLRTKEGIDLNDFEMNFSSEALQKLIALSKMLVENQLAIIQDNKFSLTLKGWFISDKLILDIISEF